MKKPAIISFAAATLVVHTPSGNTLTIEAVDAAPDANGRDFYRVLN